jgi:hypothetical protein
MGHPRRLPAAALALVAAACGSGAELTEPPPTRLPPAAPMTGEISVRVLTVGPATDPDGYAVLLDGAPVGTIGPRDTLLLDAVQPGHHRVELAGIAPGCDERASGPRDVALSGGATAAVSFTVPCAGLATVRVVTRTSGSLPDPDGYVVTVGSLAQQAIGIDDTLDIGDVPAGPQPIVLGGVAANCYLETPRRQVGLEPGQTTAVTFEVSCLGPGRGSILVSVNTSAVLVPAQMTFAVELDGAHRLPVSSNGSVTYDDVQGGAHSIRLVLPSFCGVGLFGAPGSNPTRIELGPGERREVRFNVLCLG